MKTKGSHIISVIVALFLFLISAMAVFGYNEDRAYYKDAYKKASTTVDDRTAGEMVPGKPLLEHDMQLDMSCSVDQRYDDADSSKWQAAAKGLWDATHIQFYHLKLDAPVGDGTNIKSTFDAKQYCKDYIKTLKNESIAIVYYEFVGDEYNDHYISLYDQLYYGEKVIEYLSATDMQMINNIVSYSYDFFPDYTTRDSKVWELIGNNIRDGYDKDVYTSDGHYFSESDVDYYRDEYKHSVKGMVISGVISLILFAVLAMACFMTFVVDPKRAKAAIEESEARAVRTILEADVKRMPDTADDLVDKYLGDKR